MARRDEGILDPWGEVVLRDYEKLFKLFGIRPFRELLNSLYSPHRLMRRGVVFGHRDFDVTLAALKRGELVALLTGFMPSGKMHFGHKILIDQMIYYQSLGIHIIMVLADIEAYVVRRVPRSEALRLAYDEYVANAIALGLKDSNLRIYFQSNVEPPAYYRLAQMLSQKVTRAEMEAVYGEITPAKVIASLTQAADILHPMLPEYGGYDHVFVPVGPDQDPHIRLTRDLVDRLHRELNLSRPASTYHRFMTGLDGGKMSSSRPDSAIFLTDPIEVSLSKFMRALTGGRATVEEQRKFGGDPDNCTVFEMYVYHLVESDEELVKIYEDCKSGRLLCGECKLMGGELLTKWLETHHQRLGEAREIARNLVRPPSF